MNRDTERLIKDLTQKLISKYQPRKIILFGSYASGKPTPDSDIDLFIVKDTDKSRVERFVEVKRLIYDPERGIPVSPLVYTSEELDDRIALGDSFVEEILEKGVTLYEG